MIDLVLVTIGIGLAAWVVGSFVVAFWRATR